MNPIITFFRDVLDGTTYIIVCSVSAVLLCACIGYLAEKRILRKEAEQQNKNEQDSQVNDYVPINSVPTQQNLEENNVVNTTPTQTLNTNNNTEVLTNNFEQTIATTPVEEQQPIESLFPTEENISDEVAQTNPTMEGTTLENPATTMSVAQEAVMTTTLQTTDEVIQTPVQAVQPEPISEQVTVPTMQATAHENPAVMDMPSMPQPVIPQVPEQAIATPVVNSTFDALAELEQDNLIDDTVLENPTMTSTVVQQPVVPTESQTTDEIIQTPSAR